MEIVILIIFAVYMLSYGAMSLIKALKFMKERPDLSQALYSEIKATYQNRVKVYFGLLLLACLSLVVLSLYSMTTIFVTGGYVVPLALYVVLFLLVNIGSSLAVFFVGSALTASGVHRGLKWFRWSDIVRDKWVVKHQQNKVEHTLIIHKRGRFVPIVMRFEGSEIKKVKNLIAKQRSHGVSK